MPDSRSLPGATAVIDSPIQFLLTPEGIRTAFGGVRQK
jgi:hypothetical protein